MFSHKLWVCVSTRVLSVMATVALFGAPLASAEHSSSHPAINHPLPSWAEQLKGQTIIEDTMSGKGDRAAMVEQQHQRIMEHMTHDPQVQGVNTGMFNTQSMMHQYGAGGQDMLLVSDPRVEPVAITGGGKCPATTPVKQYNVSAINVEITLNQWLDYYPGYTYVLDENVDKVRAEEAKNKEAREKEGFDPGAVIPGVQAQWIQPLTIRGNQGDCVKIKLSNKLEGGEDVSLHIHGSAMVVSATGAAATTTNADTIVAKDKTGAFEWYIHPSTQEGVRQFHTFSNDRELTVMGLFGSFVVEPHGSSYLEALGSGEATPATSGWQVMIKNGTGPDFREFVLYYHEVGDEAFRPLNKKDDFLPQRDPLTDAYRPGGRAINYRSEPFGINNMHVQHEYFGFEDESMVWTLSGHTFWTERYAPDANRKNSIHIGIAERYDLVVPEAGGPRHQAGDYIHFNGRSSKFSEGGWGIIRVYDKEQAELKKLPAGFSNKGDMPKALPVCPVDAPVKTFHVVAMDYPNMKFNPKAPDAIEVDFERRILLTNSEAKIYALEEDAIKVAGGTQPMPLTLRVNVGDCVKINLKNKMKASKASFPAIGMAFDPKDSLGANVGNNPGDQTITPGAERLYTYYADPFNGETTSLVWHWGNVMMNPRNGLFGAIVVGPKGSKYRDPKTGADLSNKNAWAADVIIDRSVPGNENRPNYRDVALFFQDEDNIIGTSFMPYVQNVAGLTGVNYRSEPYKYREEQGCSFGKVFQPCKADKPEDPATPIIESHAGDPVRIHVIGASNEQNGMFSVEKHEWPIEPFMRGADQISVVEYSGSETLDAFLPSAGGPYRLPGDYVYSNQRLPYSQSGQWGYLRVLPLGDQRLLPLAGAGPAMKSASLEDAARAIPIAAK